MRTQLYVVVVLTAVAGWGRDVPATEAPADKPGPPRAHHEGAGGPPEDGGTNAVTPPDSSATVASEGEAEFDEPSRSPVDAYSQMDASFSKYVELSLLVQPPSGPDASLLTDVALGLAEGERVLQRKHRSGLNADDLMARAVKLAARTNDARTLERIATAATVANRSHWSKLIAEAREFGAVSRDGPLVAVGKIDVSTAALGEQVRQACDVAALTGHKEELGRLKQKVAASPADSAVKAHLTAMIDGCVPSAPAKDDATGKILHEFCASSRGLLDEVAKWDPTNPGGHFPGTPEIIAGKTSTPIVFVNRTDRPVWIAVRMTRTSGSSSFPSRPSIRAWYKAEPYGGSARVGNSYSQYVSYYAHDDRGGEWSGGYAYRFTDAAGKSHSKNFLLKDMGSNWRSKSSYTFNLTSG